MRNWKKFGIIVAVLTLMAFTLTGCGNTAETNEPSDPALEENGVDSAAPADFRVALECNYAPFNWTQMDDSNGAVPISSGGYASGYDVEIAKRIADGLDRKLVIVKSEWDGLIPAINSGKADAVIAGMSPTAERKVSVDFSEPYYNSDLVVVVRKNSDYASAENIQDFSGAKITAQLNTFHYTVIDQIQGVNKQNAMDNFPAMIVALQSGKIDGYISERPGAVSAMASNPDLFFVTFGEGKGFEASLEDTAIAVAVKKGNPDLEKINEIIRNIPEAERINLMDLAVANQPAVAEGE